MRHRLATQGDCPMLALLNHQLIRDEGHRNAMPVTELEARMRAWLASGEYQAVLFEEGGDVVAYALFRETDREVYLRQFFVVRHRRREGVGHQAMQRLFSDVWPQGKRLTVSVLVANTAALAFWRKMGYDDYALTLEIVPDG